MTNRLARLLQALLARDAQLVLQMNVRGCQKNVNARPRRPLQRLPGPVDVALAGASQARNDRTPYRGGNPLYRFKIAIGGNRKPSLNHIDPKAIELLGQVQLFLHIHTAARRLLAVPKRGVENSDARPIHEFPLQKCATCLVTLSAERVKEKIIIVTIILELMIVLTSLMKYLGLMKAGGGERPGSPRPAPLW